LVNTTIDILWPICRYYIVSQKNQWKFWEPNVGITKYPMLHNVVLWLWMWVLHSGPKKPMKIGEHDAGIARWQRCKMQFHSYECEYCMVSLKNQWKFWEVDVGIMGWKHCKMQYEIVTCRYCMPKKLLCLLLMFHILCLINTTKFEFVKKQYLDELMNFLK
jgi:hypothetical protein